MFWIGSSRVQDLPLLRLIFSRALLSRGAVFGFRPVGRLTGNSPNGCHPPLSFAPSPRVTGEKSRSPK